MTLPRLLLFLTLPLYVLDQVTKFWIVGHYPNPHSGRFPMEPVIDGFFYLTRVHNQGVAFGLGNGTAWAPAVFPLVSIIAFTALWIFWKKGVFKHPATKLAVPLLLCGILGNLTDRLVQGFLLDEFRTASWLQRLSQGYVVDFIEVKLPFYDKLVPSSGGFWPAFNVADSCICIAAALLFIGSLREEKAVS